MDRKPCKPLGELCVIRQEERPCIIPLRENSCEYRFESTSANLVTVYQVDACLLGEGERKCDFLLVNCTGRQLYFIELKNANLGAAIDQLIASIDRLLPALKAEIPSLAAHARVVLTQAKGPELLDRRVRRIKDRMQQMGGSFQMRTLKFIERIS